MYVLAKNNFWAVAHWRQGIYADTVRPTRREAIAAFKSAYKAKKDWKPNKFCGVNKVIKVSIVNGWGASS